LSALDGLAAAAAHELGTPLATIALVAKELKREMPAGAAHTDDIDLLISQAARCREILSRLSSRQTASDEIFERVTISAMIEDLVSPLRGSDVTITIDSAPIQADTNKSSGKSANKDGKGDNGEPVFRRNPAITYGLGNLLENAIDFAATHVDVTARWSPATVIITVRDDGPGFDQAIADRLGDPFVTTRPGYDVDVDGNEDSTQHQGMGLGLFIAKTLLERSGASVTLVNRNPPDHGANITVTWSRPSVDVTKSG
jgi:two-component system sensor histidine kinase RegB